MGRKCYRIFYGRSRLILIYLFIFFLLLLKANFNNTYTLGQLFIHQLYLVNLYTIASINIYYRQLHFMATVTESVINQINYVIPLQRRDDEYVLMWSSIPSRRLSLHGND